MCTLSVFGLDNETIITMNRDEYRIRHETNTIYQEKGICHPVDKTAGGTWFGFNNQGIVMALLNRYQDKQIKTATSRGTIIPALLKSKNICLELDKLLEQQFNPFDLIIINHLQIIQCSWTGKELNKSCKSHPFFITSSSVDNQKIQKTRIQQFFKLKAKNSTEILNNLHLSQDINDTSSSIFMSRDMTHTKSISQLSIKSNLLNYYYFTEKDLARYQQDNPYNTCQNLKLVLPS